MGGHSSPSFVAEQAVEVTEFVFGFLLRRQTEFPLHFTHIHRSSPVTELPLRWKFPKAKGRRRWEILLLLFSIVYVAFPRSDYHALSDSS